MRSAIPFLLPVLLACSGLFGSEELIHPDGEEYYGTVTRGAGLFLGWSTSAEELERVDRVHYRVTWRDGVVASYALVHPGGRIREVVEVEPLAEGGHRYHTFNPYGIEEESASYSSGVRTASLRSKISTIRGCASMTLTYDVFGRVSEETCTDPEGRVVIDEQGCQVTRYVHNTSHDVIKRSCFDDTGRAVLDGDGIHRITITTDTQGQETIREFFGTDGAKISRASDGCAGWQITRDTAGLPIQQTCLNAGGLPTAIKNSAHAGWVDERDVAGCVSVRRYVTVGGSPATNAGITADRFTWDEHCRGPINAHFTSSFSTHPYCGLLEVSHVDASGTLRKPGGSETWNQARAVFTRNEEGLATSKQCWGDAGKSRSCSFSSSDGSASLLEFRYDEFGRNIEERGFSTDKEPVPISIGSYPHVTYRRYGPDGHLSAYTFEGVKGDRAMGLQVWVFELSYDALGAVVSQRYLDREGALMRSPSVNCAETRTNYDEKHRITSQECLGVQGEPVGANLVSASVEWNFAARIELIRDADGTVIQNRHISTNGRTLRTIDCTKLTTPCVR